MEQPQLIGQASQFNEKINSIKSQFFSALDDYKKYYVYYNKNPEVNETLVNTLKHIWESEKIFIILLPLKRLQFNILEHILVPPHRVLDESEKISIKNRYNIMDDNEFPELLRFDPVAQAIGIRPGQVCEISRPSKTAISAPYYRICI